MKYLKVWTDFVNVLDPLNDDEVGRLFLAMLNYAATGEEPSGFAGNERFLWQVAKRDIDVAAERAETLRQNGARGGRPPKSKDVLPEAEETKENQTEPNETNENQTKAEKKRKEKKGNEKTGNDIEEEPPRRFTPPTLEEISAYCRERNNGIDPQYFLDYQTARNWVLSNGKKCKDWRATVRTWEKNNYSRTPQKTVAAQAYTQRDYSGEQADAMRRMLGKIPPAQRFSQRDYSGEDDEAIKRMLAMDDGKGAAV